jgi:D-3-phosphoglycerate dehydrogenase
MRVLITDKIEQTALQTLTESGFELDQILGRERSFYLEQIGNYEGVIIRSALKFDREFIERATKLKFIARVGAGMENIDVDYAGTKGIYCINSPEGNRSAVGEHAVGMLLMLFRNLSRADGQVRQGKWLREENRGIELEGKTVGIVGYGNMGSAFARRLRGFDVDVLAYDKYKSDFGNDFVQESGMEELFRKCDIVSIHTPLTEETRYLVNKNWIDSFEKPVYLINTARGPIVHTEALVDALKSGKLAGACLDVLEYETLGFENIGDNQRPEALEYLFQSDKVVLSPHIAGLTQESYVKLTRVIVEKILKLFPKG